MVAVSPSLPHPHPSTQLQQLQQFRTHLYDCFTTWKDTLFELVDALLVGPQHLPSLPWLSLEPPLRRGHGSIYRALHQGRVDPTALADLLTSLLTSQLPGFTDPDQPMVFALDASPWPRPDAATSPERTFNYDATKDRHRDHRSPVTAGWWFQWIAATTWGHSSWALPVELTRLTVHDNHHTVAVTQIQALLHRLATNPPQPQRVPLVCLDGDYSIAWIAAQLAGQPVQVVGRLRSDAVLFTDPPPRPAGARGRPAVHGAKMKVNDPATWPRPDQTAHLPARPDRGREHELFVLAWHGLHPRHSRRLPVPHPGPGHQREVVRGNLLCVLSGQPGQKPMWLWWAGPAGSFDLDTVWRAYLHRFDIEHVFRFCKQHLGWTTPRLRTPQQATTWTWLVAAAYAQLVAARDLVSDQRLPWEGPGPLSPVRVKRGFRVLWSRLGTPARAPKPSCPGPGRPRGRISAPAPRHPVVRKRRRSNQARAHTTKHVGAVVAPG